MSSPSILPWPDLLALAYLVVAYLGITWVVRHGALGRRSTGEMVSEYRRLWMKRAARHNPRIADVAILQALQQSAAFLASGVMLTIGGVIALLGQIEALQRVANDLALDFAGSRAAAEARMLCLVAVLIFSFLKLIWAIRVFGYCAVVMGAMPGDGDGAPESVVEREAMRAAELNRLAARNFNDGLRALYFALSMLAWLLGPLPFAAAITLTVLMLMRREFLSDTHRALRFDAFR